jgi:hypothetical protein
LPILRLALKVAHRAGPARSNPLAKSLGIARLGLIRQGYNAGFLKARVKRKSPRLFRVQFADFAR